MLKFLSLSFILCVSSLFGQTTTVNLGLQGSNADFRAFPYVYSAPQSSALPLTCIIGQVYFLTNVFPNPTSGVPYNCSAANTWTQVGGASANATSLLGIPITAGATNGQVLNFNSGTNHWEPITPTPASTNGTGILLSSNVFSLDTTYTDAHYWNIGNVNTLLQQATPGVAPSAGSVKVYAKTGTNQICTFNSSSVESCSSTGTSSPGGASNSIGYNNGGAFGGFINASATKGYPTQTSSGVPTFQLVPFPIADGGTNAITKAAAFNNLSPMTAIGSIIYGGAAGVGTELLGNTTTTPKVFISTGDGANGLAPTLGLFVSSVNGQTGAVSVATGNFQTWLVNGTPITSRVKAGFAGTGGTTVSVSDNGSDTETISINSSATATPTSSGSTVPLATCNNASLGNLYTRTGAALNTNSSGSDFYVCSNTNSGYKWVLTTTRKVNVMSYGCKADGSTDDSGCFQAAINDAKLLTNYTTGFYGTDVLIPDGTYMLQSPISLPRNGNTNAGATNGVVGLIGQSINGVVLQSNSSFPIGVTAAYITSEGTGYTSAPTVAFGAGCSGTPVATAIISKTYVTKIFITSPATGCTSMPTCTLSGGGASVQGTCSTVGRAIIEWDQVSSRIIGQKIQNLNITEPPVVGSMAIHKQDTARPDTASSSGNHVEDERFEGAIFENIQMKGSNLKNLIDMYLEGDCFGCFVNNLGGNPSRTGGETINLAIDTWYDGAEADEGAGFSSSKLQYIEGGGSRGGWDASFHGRIARSNFSASFCDGMGGGNPYSQCYVFAHSSGNTISTLANEGELDNPQVLLLDANDNIINNMGLGSPALGAGNGMNLVASSGNKFDGHMGGTGTTFAAQGVVAVSLDANSHNNEFHRWQANGGILADTSVSDITTNWFQTCNSAALGCVNSPYTTYGHITGLEMDGSNTKPTCNVNTRGAIWPVRNGSGVKDQVQVCLQTGVGTTLAWTTIF